MLTRNAFSILLSFLLCFLSVILVGYVAFENRIFEPGLVYNQFVFSGLICAIYLVAIRHQKPRFAAAAGVVTYVAMVIFGGSNSGSLLLRNAVWLTALFVAVRICLYLDHLFPRLVIGKIVVWAATFGLVHLALFALLTVVNGRPFDVGMAKVATQIGAMVGVGVGLGSELSQVISARLGWHLDPNSRNP